LINQLPCLEDLSLSDHSDTKTDWRYSSQALLHLHPPKIKKFRLGLIWDTSSQIVNFLSHAVPKLQKLELRYTLHVDDNKAWNKMFMALRDVLCVRSLRIDINGHVFDADRKEDIEATLSWLAENMPDHWKIYKDSDDSEDGESEEMDREVEGLRHYRRGFGRSPDMASY
jgi:hypothetical protein